MAEQAQQHKPTVLPPHPSTPLTSTPPAPQSEKGPPSTAYQIRPALPQGGSQLQPVNPSANYPGPLAAPQSVLETPGEPQSPTPTPAEPRVAPFPLAATQIQPSASVVAPSVPHSVTQPPALAPAATQPALHGGTRTALSAIKQHSRLSMVSKREEGSALASSTVASRPEGFSMAGQILQGQMVNQLCFSFVLCLHHVKPFCIDTEVC